MDINEVPDREIFRHPWELSRTQCVLWELRRFLGDGERSRVCIDLGAGDQFFDDALLSEHTGLSLIAVDIGYTPDGLLSLPPRKNAGRITTALSLSEVSAQNVDFALMMDSLEYMTDEVACLNELISFIRPGGYLFLVLPACTALSSEHDTFVNSLRRYDKQYINGLLKKIDGIETEKEHYFYSSLFPVRLAQRVLPLEVPPEKQTINGWKYGENHLLTKAVKNVLNVDYKSNALLSGARLDIPGLSLFLACRKCC